MYVCMHVCIYVRMYVAIRCQRAYDACANALYCSLRIGIVTLIVEDDSSIVVIYISVDVERYSTLVK